MKSYHTNKIIEILSKHNIDNDRLADELAQYTDEEVFQALRDAGED